MADKQMRKSPWSQERTPFKNPLVKLIPIPFSGRARCEMAIVV